MGGQVPESELRQRKPPIQQFQPSDEGRKRDEKLDQHIRYVALFRPHLHVIDFVSSAMSLAGHGVSLP